MHFEDTYFLEEEREGFVVSSEMKRAWAAQLEVLDEIKRVCEELHITYFADWGTMLGAVRHKGFIPWDDDLDIAMLREDYMLFLEKAPALLDTWYEIKSVNFDPTHDIVKARIINGRHMCFDKDFLEKFHHCPYVVGIDIFPIDAMPDQEEDVKAQVDALKFLLKLEASVPEEGPYNEEVLSLMKDVEKNFGVTINYDNRLRHEIKGVFDAVSAKYMGQKTKHVTCMLALAADRDYYRCDRAWYEKAIEMPFENTTIPVPIGYQHILTFDYGEDYMVPQQISASHDYPFYKEQILGMKDVMEKEFGTELSMEQMQMLIHMKVFGGNQ